MQEYLNKDEIVFDCETDGFNATKIHVVSSNNVTTGSERSFIKYEQMRTFLENTNSVFIAHNVESFDKPTLERVLGIKINATIIDTLGLSWYLYPTRQLHGLAAWGEEFGVPKPEVEDWDNQPIEVYVNRCEEDVKINTQLWLKIKKDLQTLYGKENFWVAVDYICFKMKCAALQEKCKWKLDVPKAQELVVEFERRIEESKNTLQHVRPKVPVYLSKSRPKKAFKKDKSLSSTAESWKALCEEHGYDFDYQGEIKYIKGYEEPNGGSPLQIKSWLYSLGWNPQLFAYKRNKETGDVKKIEQIKNKDTGDLCPDIVRLIEKTPELQVLEDLSVLSHRKSVVQGFLDDVDENGFIAARIQGFTNTLRFRHKVFLNIPSLRKPYGKEIRGLLIARSEDMELMGADCSSLEDRTGQHFMWKYDPDYVRDMMQDDFDPHCDIAAEAGLMTADEVSAYKLMDAQDLKEIDYNGKHYVKKTLALKRHAGKSCNYASKYGAGGPTIARAAGVSEATGNKLHKAYWKRNWSLKKIAEDCQVKQTLGVKWLWNPIANMWYWLKTDKDKFSTLNQGTGTYCFDMWIKEVLKKRKQLTGQAHDEGIWEVKKGYREQATKLLKDSIQEVNKQLKLNRDLDVGVQFGENYGEIH
jgi:hypothetical protein